MSNVLVSVFCSDRTGLVSAIAGHLFEIGANLGDTSFAVLGAGAEFSSVCQLPAHVSEATLQAELAALPELAGATISVQLFGLDPQLRDNAQITHVVTVGGGDRPGLIARLSEAFTQFRANIVRMDAQRVPLAGGSRYVTRFAVSIPAASTESCLNTVANTAGELGLSCDVAEGYQA
ncbi:MAG TPA: ACT domain-containing protein [Candidatus Sulfotelmatobacter sp.]|jgi:glycine cleavage system transcriptional repressor|nr:ACT domain-containing protein [Candidatus Sulfotelmatobacter sp.]